MVMEVVTHHHLTLPLFFCSYRTFPCPCIPGGNNGKAQRKEERRTVSSSVSSQKRERSTSPVQEEMAPSVAVGESPWGGPSRGVGGADATGSALWLFRWWKRRLSTLAETIQHPLTRLVSPLGACLLGSVVAQTRLVWPLWLLQRWMRRLLNRPGVDVRHLKRI